MSREKDGATELLEGLTQTAVIVVLLIACFSTCRIEDRVERIEKAVVPEVSK